jgi:hypothetical protein
VRVEKWYLDCVNADGAGMIGYAARLNWGVFALRCSETLVWGSGQQPAVNRTVLGGALPVESPTGVEWHSRAVNADGRWRQSGAGMSSVVLYEEEAGRIEWRCCCPAAQVEVDVGGVRREGLGYAEQLIITLPPSRLPLRELHWGRFVGETQSCVWIHWGGALERSWCYHDGSLVAADRSGANELGWNGHRLRLSPGRTLRSGRVAETVFKRTPFLRRFVPSALGDVVETKWCSRGVLTAARGQRHEGWAIHEVANFP